MHEMGIVQNILEIVEQQARLHNAARVVKVSLEFGRLTGVQPDAVRFAFDVLSKGGIAENAELEIAIIPLKVYCLDCESDSILEEYKPFCPKCESASIHIVEGRSEMSIASLEIEDGDSSA